MKAYLLSAAAGLLVGVIYAVIQVRSPAPPLIALVGLLGILAGEQIPALARQVLQPVPEPPKASRIHHPVNDQLPAMPPVHPPTAAQPPNHQGSQNA